MGFFDSIGDFFTGTDSGGGGFDPFINTQSGDSGPVFDSGGLLGGIVGGVNTLFPNIAGSGKTKLGGDTFTLPAATNQALLDTAELLRAQRPIGGPGVATLGAFPGAPGAPPRRPATPSQRDRAIASSVSIISRIAACLIEGRSITECLFPARDARDADRSLTVNFPGAATMPNVSLFGPFPNGGGFPGGTSGGGVLDSLLGAVPGILGGLFPGTFPGFKPPAALPGGAPLFGGSPVAGMLPDLPFIDVVAQGSTCITPRTTTSRRLPARVDVQTVDAAGNPKVTTYKNMGRAILFQGDLAACKRVKKVAGRARRAGGR